MRNMRSYKYGKAMLRELAWLGRPRERREQDRYQSPRLEVDYSDEVTKEPKLSQMQPRLLEVVCCLEEPHHKREN